ncbi:MAG: PepSY-associated TM helix domain-containing protein [Pseudomonadota bacterium]|nr:PepSY-associated TM helix domain-containing protein [Pseudomonadota bacterium]
MSRQWFVVLHRYVGLVIAGFLVLAGITGTLLVWYLELDRAINPSLYQISSEYSDQAPLTSLQLREIVDKQYPNNPVDYVGFNSDSDHAHVFYLGWAQDAETGAFIEPENNEIFIHPHTGEILGERQWGSISQGVKNLMPFIYKLHYSLALGTIGTYTFGIIALLWTIDCFVGAYLTFPRRRRNKNKGSSWFTRWKPAWKVRWNKGTYKLNFDFHVASGLWLWAMLFVFAWSSVGFNLGEVYNPVMQAIFSHHEQFQRQAPPDKEALSSLLTWQEALEVGQTHAQQLAEKEQFLLHDDLTLYLNRYDHVFTYGASSDLNVGDRQSSVQISFDAGSGELLHQYRNYAQGGLGDTVTEWLIAFHTADVWGLPFRIFVTILGLVIAMLSVTGVIIWWRKFKARRRAAAKKARAAASLKS